jgi:hypothetical protein
LQRELRQQSQNPLRATSAASRPLRRAEEKASRKPKDFAGKRLEFVQAVPRGRNEQANASAMLATIREIQSHSGRIQCEL